MEVNQVDVLVTGAAIVGRGLRSYDAVVRELITQAEDEIMIAAYNITSSAFDVLDIIESRLKAGVRVRLVVNRYANLKKDVKARLESLNQDYNHFLLFSFIPRKNEGHMHAKALVFDRKKAIVGSTNLSHNGLVNSHEISIMVDGPAALEVADAIDRMLMNQRSNLKVVGENGKAAKF